MLWTASKLYGALQHGVREEMCTCSTHPEVTRCLLLRAQNCLQANKRELLYEVKKKYTQELEGRNWLRLIH